MKKKIFPIIIFAFAALVLIIGIAQLVLFTDPQMKMLKDALDQGYPQEEIDNYYWQQFMPQALPYLTDALFYTGVLAALGMLLLKRCCKNQSEPQPTPVNECTCAHDEEIEEFFEEFTPVEEESEE